MEPILSVVIPTHKRPQILRRCLEHLERQTAADRIEVIVVNDGHDAETTEICQQMTNGPAFAKASAGGQWPRKWQSFQFLEVPKSQQGVARNRGVREARGEFTIFIGDDIFLAPDACEKHLHVLHSPFSILHSVAVLGFTTWDPAVGITPAMRWLEQSGWQFGYPMIEQYAHSFIPSDAQHHFTYTSHISLPTEVARNFPFREDITLYGWEDVEWGWRLKNAGVKLFYEPEASALHHHHITMEESLKRMETLGRSAVMMEKLAPELRLVPRGWKSLQYRLAAMMPGMRGSHTRALLTGIKN